MFLLLPKDQTFIFHLLVERPINEVSFPRLSGTGMTFLTLFSTAEMSDDFVSKFASLVLSTD